jgi:hypothetical protein
VNSVTVPPVATIGKNTSVTKLAVQTPSITFNNATVFVLKSRLV